MIIKIGNISTWEFDDKTGKIELLSYYHNDYNYNGLDNELIPFVGEIIKNTIKRKNFISAENICKNLGIDTEHYDSKSKIKSLNKFIKENKEWERVIESKTGRSGGYKIRNIEIIDDSYNAEYKLHAEKQVTEHNQGLSSLNNSIKPTSDVFDDSLFISEYPPDGISCDVGVPFEKRWTIKNAGNQIWKNRYMRCDPLPMHLTVDQDMVAMPELHPGEEFTLSVIYKADDIGSFFSTWRIYDANGKLSFPHKNGVYVTLNVIPCKNNQIENNKYSTPSPVIILNSERNNNSVNNLPIKNPSHTDVIAFLSICEDAKRLLASFSDGLTSHQTDTMTSLFSKYEDKLSKTMLALLELAEKNESTLLSVHSYTIFQNYIKLRDAFKTQPINPNLINQRCMKLESVIENGVDIFNKLTE